MTQHLTPLYSMTMKAGESLMHDLSRSLVSSQNTQIKTNARFQSWKSVVKQPADAQSGSLVEAGMLGFFLDFLFGMPIFSGVTDAAKGMLEIGVMTHSDQSKSNRGGMSDMAALNALISQQGKRRDGFLSDQKNQTAQMKKMRQMVMMMVMMMMQEADETSGGGDESVVPDMASDVLRHPKLARFKQNRHSLSCIREMFNVQAGSVAPRFNAPRCEAA